MSDEQSIPSASKPETPASTASTSPLLWLIALISLAVGTLGLAPWFMPQLANRLPALQQQTAPQPDMAAIEARIMDQVRALIAANASAPTATPSETPAEDTGLIAKLNDALAKIDLLQTQLLTVNSAVTAQAQRLDAQQQLAGSLKDESARAAIKAVQPLLTLQAIRLRLDSGNAYQTELANLKDMVSEPERQALDKLSSGSRSLAEIADGIDNQKRQLAATYRESQAVTWWEKVKARLSGLITIKSADDNATDSVTAELNALIQQIHQGNVQGALTTIKNLPAQMGEPLLDVSLELESRKQAIAALDALGQRLADPSPTSN